MKASKWILALWIGALLLSACSAGSSTATETEAPDTAADTTPAETARPAEVGVDGSRVLYGDKVIFSLEKDMPGCSGFQYYRLPNNYRLTLGQCPEGRNRATLISPKGTVRAVSTKGDYVSGLNIEWSPDGKYLAYERLAVSGGQPAGIVLYNLSSAKRSLVAPGITGSRVYFTGNGKWLVFASFLTLGQPNLLALSLDGKTIYKLGPVPAECMATEGSYNWVEGDGAVRSLVCGGETLYTLNGGPTSLKSAVQVTSLAVRLKASAAAGNTLTLYSKPDAKSQVVAVLPSVLRGIEAAGQRVEADGVTWVKVSASGRTGYVDAELLVEE